MQKSHYSPPWKNTSLIGVAGSSGSGKTSLAKAIVESLNLPWVVILSMDSFYKVLTPDQSAKAFRSEYDFDSPDAIDFDLLVDKLRALKQGEKVEVPIYSFAKHSRVERTHTVYSPHVLILEGIFALHDSRILDLLDLKMPIWTCACLDDVRSYHMVRDVRDRGRDIEGCIKQWFSFVKPNFHRYVVEQRDIADIIVPRGIENQVAIGMVSDNVRKMLAAKSKEHRNELSKLGEGAEDIPLSTNVIVLEETNQVRGMNTVILDPRTEREDFIFYFDRICVTLLERATESLTFTNITVETPQNHIYRGLMPIGIISAVVLLRGGSIFEPALHRVLPDCATGRIFIQSSFDTGEPELHYRSMPQNISEHSRVLLLDSQMSSGGAALMAVKVLIDHGVQEHRIIFVTFFAGRRGLGRLMAVFPDITVVVCRVADDSEERWMERKYLGC